MKRAILLTLFFLTACAPALITSATPDSIPPELSIAEYPLKQPPEAESLLLYFADSVEGDPRPVHADERGDHFPDVSCMTGDRYGFCIMLGSDQLAAYEDYDQGGNGHVIVTRNGLDFYKISVGHGSPIPALRGLWVYDDHWVLETAKVTTRQEGNTIYSEAIGQITVDGVLLNQQHGYEEAFDFQTLHGRPFYFFKRGDKTGASYDGVEILLGYDEIPHFGCCSASTLNPMMSRDMVSFYARKGQTWYYAEIGVFGQP